MDNTTRATTEITSVLNVTTSAAFSNYTLWPELLNVTHNESLIECLNGTNNDTATTAGTTTCNASMQQRMSLTGTFYPELDIPNILILCSVIILGLSNAGVIICFFVNKKLRKPFNWIPLGKCAVTCLLLVSICT